MIDWQAIKTEYITTNTSYRKLAEKYGINRAQIGVVGNQEGWVELRRQFVDSTMTKTLETISAQEANRTARILNVADKLLNKIEALAGRDAPLNEKAIRSLTAALKDLKEIQGVKSDLDIQEQEARIANLRKQADKSDDAVDELEVVFAAGPEEWNE